MIHILLVDILHRLQSLFQCGGAVCNLSVRKDLSRFDGIAVTDLPRGNADLLCQHIDQGFQCKLTLAYAKAAERTGRRVIGIVTIAADVCVLVTVWTHGMGAGTLQNRSAKRCISAGIEIDLTVQSGENTVFVTAQRKGSFHGMTLRMEE